MSDSNVSFSPFLHNLLGLFYTPGILVSSRGEQKKLINQLNRENWKKKITEKTEPKKISN